MSQLDPSALTLALYEIMNPDPPSEPAKVDEMEEQLKKLEDGYNSVYTRNTEEKMAAFHVRQKKEIQVLSLYQVQIDEDIRNFEKSGDREEKEKAESQLGRIYFKWSEVYDNHKVINNALKNDAALEQNFFEEFGKGTDAKRT